MKNSIKYMLLITILTGCTKQPVKWQFEKEIALEKVRPIGVTILKDKLWLSDGDKNRLVQIDGKGKITEQIENLERPMHIASSSNSILIPEYGKDVISIYTDKQRDSLIGTPKLDAPAGVDKKGNEIAIADFYNNSIHYYNGNNWLTIGGKGKANGELNYPTDVQFFNDFIYVADAYNHRVQVFDKKGRFIKILAENLEINAATGIFVTDKELYVTDFENSRILVISHKNGLLQEIKQGINKPTDMVFYNEKLYVTNYKSGNLAIFKR